MKPYSFYFFTPENGGTWLTSTVYAKSKQTAKKMVSNLYYVPINKVKEV